MTTPKKHKIPFPAVPKLFRAETAGRRLMQHMGWLWLGFILLFGAIVLYCARLALSISAMGTSKAHSSVRRFSPTSQHQRNALPYPVILAMVHYATSNITPQQTREEIMVTANILSTRGPCNFLVFGLGLDSPLWQALNHGGLTLFLEEDPSWISQMTKAHPSLKAFHVNYTTMLYDADNLLAHAQAEKDQICAADADILHSSCKLAITTLPDQVYSTKWDVIMIDAPRGYFPEAPGRMSAIFTSAVFARRKLQKQSHNTDILIHDVDRPAEKSFSIEFCCAQNLVEAVGKLWHFRVSEGRGKQFCSFNPPRVR